MSGASLVSQCFEQKDYWDKKSFTSIDDWKVAISQSCCVYVGNLSVFTTEDQLYFHFGLVGDVEKVQMGLCQGGINQGRPAGFCFVFYKTPEVAKEAVRTLNRTRLDERELRVDPDPGNNIDTRKFGRGKKTGMQIRDDFRTQYDRGRMGYGGGERKPVGPYSGGPHGRRIMNS